SRDSGFPPHQPPLPTGTARPSTGRGLPDPAGHKYRPGRARRGSSPHTAVRVAPPSEHTARPARRHHLEEHVWRYIGRKSFVYVLTFVVAVTVNWMIPRFMPGDPVRSMLSRASVSNPEALERMTNYYSEIFGLDTPLHQQYLSFWAGLFRGDLGISVLLYPEPVTDVIMRAIPYTLALLVPAIILSWIVGNRFGAFAARSKMLDNSLLPVGYILTATPYMWLALLMAWSLGIVAGI